MLAKINHTVILHYNTIQIEHLERVKTQDKTMIRIKPTRRIHVSNRLALAGALTLSLTLFTGMDGMHKAASESVNDTAVTAVQPNNDSKENDPAERSKRFSISRLLFGHG
jgi:hypothetical protein